MAPKSSGSKPKGTDRPPDPGGAPAQKPATRSASKQTQPAKVDFTTVQPTQKAQESLKGKEKEGGEGAKAAESSEDEGDDDGSDEELKAAVALSKGDDAGVGEVSFDNELALVSPAKPSTAGLPAGVSASADSGAYAPGNDVPMATLVSQAMAGISDPHA